jgi:GT2 family glycosyltransferase
MKVAYPTKLFLQNMDSKKKSLTLSIVIVNYNTKELTLKCLDSIQRSSDNVPFEVILVDNGSTDGSAKEFVKFTSTPFWRQKFILIGNKINLGYARANNQGIRRSVGHYVLLLNSDTRITKGSLKALIDFANKTPDVGVVGSRLLNADGSVQASCYNFPSIMGAIKEYWGGLKGIHDGFSPPGQKPVIVNSVVGAAFLITPLALKKVGMLNERYFAYYEDLDYCREVWRNGLKVYYLPKSRIYHTKGGTFNKLTEIENRWRKLVPGSIIYNGFFRHYVMFFIMWTGQKWSRFHF